MPGLFSHEGQVAPVTGVSRGLGCNGGIQHGKPFGARALRWVILVGALLCAEPAWAQTAGQPAPGAADAPAAPTAAEASVGHAALKGITLKLTQGLYSFGVFTVGAGVGVATGAAMAVADGVGAYAFFVANEYLWDTLSPNTNLRANNESFGVLSSLSRTTLKYLTYKPAVTAWHWGLIYAMTGSVQTMVVAGSVLWFTLPMMFYVNDTAWNLYDWSTVKGAPNTPPAAAAGGGR
jgi:hypothetical protein